MKYLRNRYFLLTDVLLLILASYVSYVLRLEGFDLKGEWSGFALFTALGVCITPLVFWKTGVYSRYWRYASIEELLLLTGAVTASGVLTGAISITAVWLLPGKFILPRSVPLIFLMLALGVTAGPRLFVRFMTHYPRRKSGIGYGKPVVVVGAGDAGVMVVRELLRKPELGMDVVGFLDDDTSKQGLRIHGIPVLGQCDDISRIVTSFSVRQVIIAMPTAPGRVIREIVRVCEKLDVQTKIIPGMFELLDGKFSVSQLRTVQIEDLLRREPIQTDIASVEELIRGKRVLVTGGGGSIGSELCRQVLRFHPAELILLGHGENSIFTIHSELQRILSSMWSEKSNGSPPTKLSPVIADIRFAEDMQRIFHAHQPHIVFHASAHKHVPLMELNPSEAITNNIIGTRNLLQAAQATGVERFVMISTDKAVNPTSLMGASKRVAELLVHQAAMKSGKPYVAVRFGNVLGSRGSVVLTFKQQIAEGGPVTVTHPDMRRYFMTIPEAVQLVLQAAVLGECGKVFMLDMGDPVKIVDLARDMIELSGLEVGHDIEIAFTGMRPGEKLFEELFLSGEEYEPTCHEKIAIAVNASNGMTPHLDETIADLAEAAHAHSKADIIRLLQTLVPEYQLETTDVVPNHSEKASMPSASSPSASSQSDTPSASSQSDNGASNLHYTNGFPLPTRRTNGVHPTTNGVAPTTKRAEGVTPTARRAEGVTPVSHRPSHQ